MWKRGRALEMQVGKDMIETVIKEWELQHPGQSPTNMTGKEFADRVMAKMKETARFTDEPSH